MVKTRALQVRLTREQHEQMRLNAHQRGFSHLSTYLRYVALRQDFVLHQQVAEMHRHLLGPPPKRRKRSAREDYPTHP